MVRVVSDMLKARHRQTTFDGLSVRDKLDVTGEGMVRSVVVERVEPGSPAATANLQKGDVITRIADVNVFCSYDIDRGLLDRQPNETLSLVVRRQGVEQRTELVLQSADRTRSNVGDLVWKRLGLRVSPMSSEVVTRINAQLHGGLEVVLVRPDGAAAKAGLKKGDILVGLHQWETLTLDNVAYVLTNPDLGNFMPLSFYIIRSGQVRRGWVQQLD